MKEDADSDLYELESCDELMQVIGWCGKNIESWINCCDSSVKIRLHVGTKFGKEFIIRNQKVIERFINVLSSWINLEKRKN